jgi:hypothetical protein
LPFALRGVARGGGEWQLAGFDEVASAHLDRIQAGAARHHVDQTLADERAERHADTAIGAGRTLVGRHRVGLVRERGELVRPRQDAGGGQRLERRRDRIDGVRARVADQRGLDGEQRTVLARANLYVVHVVARLRARQQIFAAILEPAHRPPQPPRQRGHHDVLRIEMHLRPEAAADRRAQDPDARVR